MLHAEQFRERLCLESRDETCGRVGSVRGIGKRNIEVARTVSWCSDEGEDIAHDDRSSILYVQAPDVLANRRRRPTV
jgi:hypothetical protein